MDQSQSKKRMKRLYRHKLNNRLLNERLASQKTHIANIIQENNRLRVAAEEETKQLRATQLEELDKTKAEIAAEMNLMMKESEKYKHLLNDLRRTQVSVIILDQGCPLSSLFRQSSLAMKLKRQKASCSERLC